MSKKLLSIDLLKKLDWAGGIVSPDISPGAIELEDADSPNAIRLVAAWQRAYDAAQELKGVKTDLGFEVR